MLPDQVRIFYRRDAFIILCAVLLVYANSFSGTFQFDDYRVIVNNAVVHTWEAWWNDVAQGIRPLLKLSYAANWMSGWGVAGFHLANVALHLCNSMLVWLLARHFILANVSMLENANLPLFAALLFALHPAQTEAVTYICGRSVSLMAVFYLGGLLLYIYGRKNLNNLYLHVLVPLCMLLSLSTKETAVTFPAALLLWEIYTGGNLKTAWRYQWSSWLALVFSAIYFAMHGGYHAEMQNSLQLNSLSGNAATQLLALVYLLRQALVPLWLNIDPDLPIVHSFAGMWPHMLILFALLWMAVRFRQSRPWISFAIVWALLHWMVIYLVLPRLDVANDRQIYLAIWPLALVVVIEMKYVLNYKLFNIFSILIVFFFVVLTLMRNSEYASEIALWESTVRYSPGKARVQNNLGYAYMLAGRKEEARSAFQYSLKLDRDYFRAKYNLLVLERTSQ